MSFRLWFMQFLVRLIPGGCCGRLRAVVYRSLGLSIGPGTMIAGTISINASAGALSNIRIGNRCFINSHVHMDATAPVLLGDGVSIGHHVLIVTANHEIGSSEFRAGIVRGQPVTILDGAWVATGAIILPGVTVGRGAVVAAGAVVARDVPPDTLVGGVPAQLIRSLAPPQ